jgi:ankyrin repeat protein
MARLEKIVQCVVLFSLFGLFLPSATAKTRAKTAPLQSMGANSLIIKRNYKAAFIMARALADKGDAQQQLKVAEYYRLGFGTKRDDAAALYWVQKAAASGNRSAKLMLQRYNAASIPATPKKSSDGVSGGQNELAVDLNKLPSRGGVQPGWLTLATARKNTAIALQLTALNAEQAGLSLITAVRNNDVALARKLGASPIEASPDPRGITPLMLASANGNEEMIKALLDIKQPLEVKDISGSTAISVAAQNCRPVIFSELVAGGALIDGKDGANSALIEVVKNCTNWLEFKGTLKGAMFNRVDQLGRSAAWYAAAKGDAALLAWLVDSGADLAIGDKDGFTPLHAAAVGQNFLAIRYIVSKLGTSDLQSKRGTTPLMIASWAGCEDCAMALIDKTTDVNFKNVDGDTALVYAIRGKQGALAAALIEKGANINARNLSGDTAGKIAELLNVAVLKGTQ